MAPSFQTSLYGLLVSSALLAGTSATPSVPIVFCASVNTATTSSNSSIYQSDGLCHDLCFDSFAYAVINGQECWCSDITPGKGSQVPTSECNTPCAGYPTDLCGGDGLFGYMSLNKDPSGTATSSSSSSSSSSTSTSTTSTSTQATITTSTHTTSSTSIKSTPQTKPNAASPTVQTVTAGGVVQTVTVTPVSGSGSESPVTSKHKGLGTGGAVGIAIGVVAIAVIAAAVAFIVWRRRRRQQEPDDALFAANNPKTPSPRGASPNASNSPQISEVTAAPAFARRPGEGQWESDQSGRRRSALMPIDPRIDPAFSDIYSRADNKSRDSVNSLRDDHDYSRRVHQPNRVLRAMNPDPDVEH